MGNVVVFGASGYIGRNLLKFLKRMDVECYGVSRRDDLNNASIVIDYSKLNNLDNIINNSTIVINCIGVNAENIKLAKAEVKRNYELNYKNTCKVIDYCAARNVNKFINLSSTKIYNSNSFDILNEDSIIDITNEYAIIKYKIENYIINKNKNNNFNYINLRISMVYGGDGENNILKLIIMIKKGYRIPIPNLKNKRSMLYIDDLLQCIYIIIKNSNINCDSYIITGNDYISGYDLCELIREKFGISKSNFTVNLHILKLISKIFDIIQNIFRIEMPITSNKLEKLIGDSLFSSMKFQAVSGWVPIINIERGIEMTIKNLSLKSEGKRPMEPKA